MDQNDQQVIDGLMAAMLHSARRAVEQAEQPEADPSSHVLTVQGLIPHLRRLHALGVWRDEDALLVRMEEVARKA